MTQNAETADSLKQTPLHDLHLKFGAKMVPFAGYEMPVNYPLGVLGEHAHVRASVGLFDVSHMGQAILSAPSGLAEQIERLVPGDVAALQINRMRLTMLLNEDGGILDDLMITRLADKDGRERLFLVVNAACKDADFAHIQSSLPGVELTRWEDRALVALQGPKAAEILAQHFTGVDVMPFMSMLPFPSNGGEIFVSRSGYTGEDGYEISIPSSDAVTFVDKLLEDKDVEPIGLGARDSLRLEAGMCLYGHDIDETTSPVEAGLTWTISKRRRAEGGFPGAARIQDEIANGAKRKRVGILPDGRAPAREGTEIYSKDGKLIGKITSGGFGPSHGGPVAMGYVEKEFSAIGTEVDLIVRGKARPARVAAMPFVPNHYYRSK